MTTPDPYYADDTITLHAGDCLDVLRQLDDESVDAIVTDPPYGLGFMGQKWDTYANETGRAPAAGAKFDHIGGNHNPSNAADAARTRRVESRRFGEWCQLWATECLRVLKPGGHLLAFGGSRTWHRLAVAIEDGGFELRDSIAWLYGSGFPKSLDVSKAIDKARDDKAEVLAVTSRLAALAEAAGITRADIDAHMETSDMGGWWLSRLKHRCACPSVDNWTRLRDYIPGAAELDEQVWHLNGRKGSPGEAWDQRKVIGTRNGLAGSGFGNVGHGLQSAPDAVVDTAPATPDAVRWQGWGTALKPAFEPVVVARKPLAEKTVAANVLEHGTGALNIDGCRIGYSTVNGGNLADNPHLRGQWQAGTARSVLGADAADSTGLRESHAAGRWPANVVLDESQAEALDQQSGTTQARIGKPRGAESGDGWGMTATGAEYDDLGGASRFFYTAKADAGERVKLNGTAHPTVKPLSLMRWLVRLVTPPGGVVLEPFAGSGTTVEACVLEGFGCVAVEREAEYLPLIVQRVARRRDPVAAVLAAADEGDDVGLFGLLDS